MARARASDLLIIGGGIVGVSHALAAAARGLSVTLVERAPGGVAADASARNFGLLTRLYDDGGVWGARAARSRALYGEWAARFALPLRVTGSLQLAQTDAQWTALRALAARAPRALRAELLDARAARAAAPALAPAEELHGALHFPDDALLEPREMFRFALPRALAAAGVATVRGTAALALARDGAHGVRVRCADGATRAAGAVALCAGADAATLLPRAFARAAPALRVCKLQMLRVALPPPPRGAPPPRALTSGLSLRRYPALAAHAGAAAAAALAAGDAHGLAAEEALGVHVIARPAAAPPRGAWGGVAGESAALSDTEWVVGDSHEYVPLGGALDDATDEGVADAILRVAAGMLRGVRGLVDARAGGGAGGGEPRARVLAQWAGTYLQHDAGVFAACARAQGPRARWEEADEEGRGAVHIVTGLGGKGMTMSPALAEENVARWFG
jgi:glycine/D-amino acid oxidase-like deaminating enzyme